MKLLTSTVLAMALAACGATGALAQQSPNGTPGAVPGVGPGGSGAQSGSSMKPMQSGSGQGDTPGSMSADPKSPTNTTGQPAGDKPAQ